MYYTRDMHVQFVANMIKKFVCLFFFFLIQYPHQNYFFLTEYLFIGPVLQVIQNHFTIYVHIN